MEGKVTNGNMLGLFLLMAVIVMEINISLQQQCPSAFTSQHGYALVGSEFKSFISKDYATCMIKCDVDDRCMSVNFHLTAKKCDLNTQTKESRPACYQARANSVYTRNMAFRTPKFAKPCREILATCKLHKSGEYWIDPEQRNKPIRVLCDMTTDGDDVDYNQKLKEVLNMGKSISKSQWSSIEGRTLEGQKKFFSSWGNKVKRKCVKSAKRNVKMGDHLEAHRYGYDHHFICSGRRGDTITVIEYGGPHFEMSLSEVLAMDVEKLAKVHEREYTFKQLEKEEVMKIVWPKKLRRHNRKESVRRARKRIEEKKYDCLHNNCEHFVMWCIFGIKISLQLQTWHKWAKECVNSLCVAGKECITQGSGRLVPFLLKVLANASDEIAVGILSQKYAAFVIGVAIGAAIEAGLIIYELKKAFDQKESGELTEKLFYAKVIEIVAKSVLRLGLGAAGSAVGSLYGPLGSLAGGALAAIAGHLLGKLIAWFMAEHILSNSDVEQGDNLNVKETSG